MPSAASANHWMRLHVSIGVEICGEAVNRSEWLTFAIGGSGVGLEPHTSSSQLLARCEALTSSLPLGESLGPFTDPLAAGEQAPPGEC